MVNCRVAIVLVNWRRPADTVACVRSLVDLIPGQSVSVFVCDNGSPDDSLATIASGVREFSSQHNNSGGQPWQRFSHSSGTDVFIFSSGRNLGFAGGNNFAISLAEQMNAGAPFDYYWILNNDTEVDKYCLQRMLQKMEGSPYRVGMCGSTMVYFHDKRTVQALGGSTYRPWAGTMREIGNGTSWPASVNEEAIEAEMSYVCGASMLVSAELIRDVGLMREDYFLFFEEIDWCERARRAGYKLAYASNAIVYHKEGVAIGTGTGAKRSLLAEYYGMRNRLLVAWRLFPWTFPSVWLIGWLQVARRALQRRPANAWIMAKVLCGLGKRPV